MSIPYEDYLMILIFTNNIDKVFLVLFFIFIFKYHILYITIHVFLIHYCRIAGHQANVFMVEKSFFMQLGGFDTGMKVWGVEMMELMFKVRIIFQWARE